MFKHIHPYPPFIPDGTEKLIVGTLPPPRFTTGDLKPGDVDFCYGSKDGQLWQILSRTFDIELLQDGSEKAVEQRIWVLKKHKIGICDIVNFAYRDEVNASDYGMKDAHLRPLIPILKKEKSVKTLLFTGGNSKNGPEYFFRRHLRDFPDIELKSVDETVPRIYQFKLGARIIKTVSLTAPSGAANRAVGSMTLYKKLKDQDPEFNTIDFRVMQYAPFFKE
jgi:G:T/U-mismatch repair DNA glycosylase